MVALLHCTQYDFYNATIHDVDFDDDGVTSHDHGPKTMTGKKQQYAFVCPLYAYIYIPYAFLPRQARDKHRENS